MSDEPNELGELARVAFRAFYGKDDPIVFSDLTVEQRKRFESVAVAISKRQASMVSDRRELVGEAVQAVLAELSESAAEFISKLRTIDPFLEKSGAFDAIVERAYAEGKRQEDRWKP